MNASVGCHGQNPVIGLALVSLLVTGCGQDEDSQTAWQPKMVPGETLVVDSEVAVPPEVEPPQPVTVEPGTWQDVQDLVVQSTGKIVVVDVWSTSCLPCIKELPQLGRLQRDHPDDVVCVSLSLDYIGIKSKPPESYRERVQKILEKCEVNVRNYLCTTDADIVFQDLDLPSIPAVYVYGTDGKLAQRFDGSLLNEDSAGEEPFTYEADIVPLVEQLMASRE